MTNRERLDANKARIGEHFRNALRARHAMWDADRNIEHIVGEISGLDAELSYLAACCELGAVETVTDDEAAAIIGRCLVDPSGDCEAVDEV